MKELAISFLKENTTVWRINSFEASKQEGRKAQKSFPFVKIEEKHRGAPNPIQLRLRNCWHIHVLQIKINLLQKSIMDVKMDNVCHDHALVTVNILGFKRK